MKKLLIFIHILLVQLSIGQSSAFKLFLIGDTGDDEVMESTMTTFLDTIRKYPNSAAVFLGDNCYKKWILDKPKGFDSTELAILRLGSQLAGLDKYQYKGSVYFIPGNHDWWNATSIKKGTRHLQEEELYIETLLSKNTFIQNKLNPFMPENGNPIAAVDLNSNQLKVIFVDTHWLIIQKNDDERAKAYSRLDSILTNAISHHQEIVVASHHPIYTMGKHSKKHWIPNLKQFRDQDLYYPSYKEWREKLVEIFSSKNYPIIHASGHDHVLEYFQENSVHYIVSGSGSKLSRFNKKHEFNPKPEADIPENRVTRSIEGFFEIEYSGDHVSVSMITMDNPPKKELIK